MRRSSHTPDRRTRRLMAVVVTAAFALAACGGTTPPAPPTPSNTVSGEPVREVALVDVADDFDAPVQVVPLPDGSAWVVQRSGQVVTLETEEDDRRVVADLSSRLTSGGEQGLLSVALHPNFPTDGRVYVHFTDREGNTRVQEHVADAQTVTPEPARVLLEVTQPFENHNGGSLAFGSDGLLYLGLGDGGSSNDPDGNGQDLTSNLGKLLALDVESASAEWRIAAYGLRNPWRFSFDPVTGDGWIGDVGQNRFEEINRFPKDAPLLNFGWDVYEGPQESTADDRSSLNRSGTLTDPVIAYDHDEGCSVTGGVVVRDPSLPPLTGRYVYGDYCEGTVWSIPITAPFTPRVEPFRVDDLVSIDAAPEGPVYLTSLAGTVFRLTTT